MIDDWNDCGYFCKKRFMLFVILVISLVCMIAIGTAGAESNGFACSCNPSDNLCCTDGKSYVCPGQCNCRDKGSSGNTFCSAGNEESKLDGAAQVF